MNKWIIFIIIVVGVFAIGAGVNLVTSHTSTYKVDIADSKTVTQQKPDLVVRFANISKYPVSQGVLVVHNQNFSMNFLGEQPPEVYTSLAEDGDPSEVIAALKETPTISEAFEVATIKPGAMQEVAIPLAGIRRQYADIGNIRISYMAKIEGVSDGVAWLNGHAPYTTAQQKSILTEVIDMGITTNGPVQHYLQFYEEGTAPDGVVQINIDKVDL